jgi:hypothetical protein
MKTRLIAPRNARRTARAIALAAILVSVAASAQVPPHQPGTICFTSGFWCWMQTPGIPGQVCWCPSPYGPVQGVIG